MNTPAFALHDGTRLHGHDWPVARPRARLLVVHGLGEHGGRYAALAADLNAIGISVRAYDQRGHGTSDGKKGAAPAMEAVLSHDLLQVFAAYGSEADDMPFLLGHSLGGLVVLHATLVLGLRPRGLIASSPALATFAGGFDRWLANALLKLAPDLTVNNRLKVEKISHDAGVVRAYRADPLVHDRISARIARYIFDAGPEVIAAAPRLAVPTLLQFAGSDALVNPAGARAFAPKAPPGMLTALPYPDLYHEIYNEAEPSRSRVVDDLKAWLQARLEPGPP